MFLTAPQKVLNELASWFRAVAARQEPVALRRALSQARKYRKQERASRDPSALALEANRINRILSFATIAAVFVSVWVGLEATKSANFASSQAETARNEFVLESKPVLFLSCDRVNRTLDKRSFPKDVWFLSTGGFVEDNHYDDAHPPFDQSFFLLKVSAVYERCALSNYGRTSAVDIKIPVKAYYAVTQESRGDPTMNPTTLEFKGVAAGQTFEFIIANSESVWLRLDIANFGTATNLSGQDPTQTVSVPIYKDNGIDIARDNPLPPVKQENANNMTDEQREKAVEEVPRVPFIRMH